MNKLCVAFIQIALVGCSTTSECQDSLLSEVGIVGNWEIYQRTDIVSLLPEFQQGEDLVIAEDSICDDFGGKWDYSATNSENGGEFVVDTAAQEITFFTPSNSFRWVYEVVDYDNLVFRYNESGLEIKELWRRK